MKKKSTLVIIVIAAVIFSFSFKESSNSETYTATYHQHIGSFRSSLEELMQVIEQNDIASDTGNAHILEAISAARKELKNADIWLRYLEPIAYKKINGPLPVEWETEVFEKFEQPYKRECAGLTLAELYLEEEGKTKDSLLALVKSAYTATDVFLADSITTNLEDYHHFYLCNRLYLLNLAAIYTTAFECPNADMVIPELRAMMNGVNGIYQSFNASYPGQRLSPTYMELYRQATAFVKGQPDDPEKFDHYEFIRDYVNPLYIMNQRMINKYKVASRNLVDYSLTKNEVSIFDKALYNGQDPRGIFSRARTQEALDEIDRLGKLLFYDPLLSGNNMRSCASCHKPTEFFTDTMSKTAFHFDHRSMLPRNTPSLVNSAFNHLLMADGKHYTLQRQAKDVISNPIEMGCKPEEIVKKVMSCNEYKKGFQNLLQYTPTEKEVTLDHIVSALTFYYSKFSKYYSPFDQAMNGYQSLSHEAQAGFNIFMSKAQCATCHFAPQFNGVKPPYIGSEFEVLGVPADTSYKQLSADKGRYDVFQARETMRAFRTGSVRNASYTKPYMHNGVFNTLEEVIEFYNTGGGAGHGLDVPNQTLGSDSLHLTKEEKRLLITFIQSLDEDVKFEPAPEKLPKSKMRALNARKPGGVY